MTKIMIDDVDVSGCIYYRNGKCRNSDITQYNCANVASCYFKEYKRKEQECEMLKYGLGLANSYVNKYFQAFQEIKEIAENKLNWTADYKTYFKRDNKSIKQEGFKALAEILQKCEVINDTARCN